MSPLKAAILAASPTDLIFADLSTTASPNVAVRVAKARAAATAASKKGEPSRFGTRPKPSRFGTRPKPSRFGTRPKPSRFGTPNLLAPNMAGEVSSLERMVEVSRTDDAKAAMEELKVKAEQAAMAAAKAAEDDEADPTKPLTWPLAYAVESEASAAASAAVAEAEAAKEISANEVSSEELSAEGAVLGAPSTAPTSPKPPLSPRITSLASPRDGDSSALQKLQSAAKTAINPTPEEARDTPITRAFKEKIAAERESFIKSREPDWR